MSMGSIKELTLQNEMIVQMIERGWARGRADGHDRERVLYSQDMLTFMQTTQPQEWERFVKIYPTDTECHLSDVPMAQLKKADISAIDVLSRACNTLGVPRHGTKSHSACFSLCQFKPERNLNPETPSCCKQDICHIALKLVYSPHASNTAFEEMGVKTKKRHADLALFVNGLSVAMLKSKPEPRQTVQNTIMRYKKTRPSKDPGTNKPEPSLASKCGTPVHLAASQYEMFMATKLDGNKTLFLPSNKGTRNDSTGNDTSGDVNDYVTSYLQSKALLPDSLLKVLTGFAYLQVVEKENVIGLKYKSESLILPRYHQWDVVNKLITAAIVEGTGNRYLIRHSAELGKSNSIAWTAHQFPRLYDENGEKQSHPVIVVMDRIAFDGQLQDTTCQFEHQNGVVRHINSKEGDGPKPEKLVSALENSQPITIVTTRTFLFVLETIENSINLKQRKCAAIADEAYSSQSGSMTHRLKEVLMIEEASGDIEMSSEDILNVTVTACKSNNNLNYYVSTATPKAKTLKPFDRRSHPQRSASKTNKPKVFRVYSMCQAIEEGSILDVSRNYANYKAAYKPLQELDDPDRGVDSKRAKIKLNQWVSLHDHNVSQKVKVIVGHFRRHVMYLLAGRVKAMVVASSREAVTRHKLAFDRYIAKQKYDEISVMMMFSGKAGFHEDDRNSPTLLNQGLTGIIMNPGLKSRGMRKAFDTDDYQAMLVANKFQTSSDQLKLCATYVDKKPGGVECVRTLSRLNHTHPGKVQSDTFVLDFYNEPKDISEAFQSYYQAVKLIDAGGPQLASELYERLCISDISLWSEMEQFCEVFFNKNKPGAAINNICRPTVERRKHYHISAIEAYVLAREMLERTKKIGDVALITNAENTFRDYEKRESKLGILKKDFGSFVRFYEFMSQIADYDDKNLEKLSLSARHPRPLLHEQRIEEGETNLGNVGMSYYRLLKFYEQHLKLQEDATEYKITPGNDIGTAKSKDKKKELLSDVLVRLNELFVTGSLTGKDIVNYTFAVCDKLSEGQAMMTQIANNTREQAMLGDFPKTIGDAVVDSNRA